MIMDDMFTYTAQNISQAVSHFIDNQNLNGSIKQIDHELAEQFCSAINRIINSSSIEHSKRETQNWQWTEIQVAEDYNIGILHIYAGKHIPIHDHPGSFGLLYILQGELQLKQYQVKESRLHLTDLELLSTQDLKESEFTDFSPHKGNIHSLHANNGDVFILDILVSPYSIYERQWFLPIDSTEINQPSFTTASMKKKMCFN